MQNTEASERSAEDIYAPPKARLERAKGFHVSDGLLVAQSLAVLPRRCVKTGVEDSVDETIQMFSRKFVDTNRWTISIVRKRCDLTYGLSDTVRAQLSRRLLTGRLVFACGVIVGVFGFMGEIFSVFLIGGVVAVIGALVKASSIPLKVIRSSAGRFYIKGCCPAFLDSISRDEIASIT